MKMIGLALIVAVIVEALIEYGQTVYDMVEEGELKKAIKQGCAIAVAVIFAFALGVTLLEWLLSETYNEVTVNPVFDMIVSGIFMSRGANYLSDLIRMVFKIGTHEDAWDDWGDGEDEDEEDEDEPTTEGDKN